MEETPLGIAHGRCFDQLTSAGIPQRTAVARTSALQSLRPRLARIVSNSGASAVSTADTCAPTNVETSEFTSGGAWPTVSENPLLASVIASSADNAPSMDLTVPA